MIEEEKWRIFEFKPSPGRITHILHIINKLEYISNVRTVGHRQYILMTLIQGVRSDIRSIKIIGRKKTHRLV